MPLGRYVLYKKGVELCVLRLAKRVTLMRSTCSNGRRPADLVANHAAHRTGRPLLRHLRRACLLRGATSLD